MCVCQTLALAVPVWGGPLVLANSVWSYLLCFMFLASRGHKQPFVAKRWLVSLQTDSCSCSPLLDISMCVRACVRGYMCICAAICIHVCTCKYVWMHWYLCVCIVCVCECRCLCMYSISVCMCVRACVLRRAILPAGPTMSLSFHLGDSDLSNPSPDTFTIISLETAGQGRTEPYECVQRAYTSKLLPSMSFSFSFTWTLVTPPIPSVKV